MQMIISSVGTTVKLCHPTYAFLTTSVLVVINIIVIIVWTVPFDCIQIYHGYFITEYNSYCNQLGV